MHAGLSRACDRTGFVPPHAVACRDVARCTDCVILFREPGRVARGLIEENYSMKGFRIDTKSCDWGPMAGFVCADPRLTKDPKYEAKGKNPTWTREALQGHINEEYFGKVHDPAWVADVMPIVISEHRIRYLVAANLIAPTEHGGGYRGVSVTPKADASGRHMTLPWRLVPVGNAVNSWLKDATGAAYYVLCVDKSTNTSSTRSTLREPSPSSFAVTRPSSASPIRAPGHVLAAETEADFREIYGLAVARRFDARVKPGWI